MRFHLLGEVQLWAGDRQLDAGTPRQQAVLAALAVDARRPVAIETLIDRVWDQRPPAAARSIVYSHLSRIRHLLRQAGTEVRVERRHAGYVLAVEPDLVDLHRFADLVGRGRDPLRDDAERAGALDEALGLWHGVPLAGIAGAWADQVRDTWHRHRLDALVQWGQVELRLERTQAVIATLSTLIAEYPLAEPLEVLLMRALHLAGRDAEAVERYSLVAARLAGELGTDPGPELRALHAAILRGELPPAPIPAAAILAAIAPAAVAPARAVAPPAQLPPDLSGFSGRAGELEKLDLLLVPAGALTTVVVSGTAGVGKTTLAVHWAHRVRDRFPDGQLYVNLRGFDPAGSPVRPAEAVRGFLDAFGVPPERIPTSLEAQVGLHRSLLAGRRVLLLLDNARDAGQVRPLLPGAPGCLVVVTSRNRLDGLVAEGAQAFTLDLLDPAEGHELLARRLGAGRVAAEPAAAAEIVALCARLPLALAVVAARAAAHPGFSLAVLADDLRQARGGLDEFAGTDPATDARAVFSWSYLRLSAPAARVFRLLGLHPGPDVATRAVAGLAGVPASTARALLAELARAHLVTEHVPGRHAIHDLLRAYAAEQAQLVDPVADRRAAVRRMLAYYVHSADAADLRLNPHRYDPPRLPALPDGVCPEQPPDHGRALAWFDAERLVLLALIRDVTGSDADVWHLAWAVRRFLAYQGHWPDSVDALAGGLAAARRLADPGRQAFAECFLGCAYVRFGRYDEARRHLQAAVDLYAQAGDTVGEGNAHHHFSWLLEQQKLHREALPHARRALDLFRTAGHRAGQAKSLNAVGWFHALLGEYAEALEFCQQALDLQLELGDRLSQAETWDSLGYAHHRLGRHGEAVTCYQTAVELYREFQYRYNEADVLGSLGEAHHAAGNVDSARTAWRRALDVLDHLGHPDADEIRAKLDRMAD